MADLLTRVHEVLHFAFNRDPVKSAATIARGGELPSNIARLVFVFHPRWPAIVTYPSGEDEPTMGFGKEEAEWVTLWERRRQSE